MAMTQKQKGQLHSFLISEFTDVKWAPQNSAILFKRNNLVLEDIQPENKWKIRCKIKTKGIYILQCCCGNDIGLKNGSQDKYTNLVLCMQNAYIKKDKDNNYISIFGYLKHVEGCQCYLSHQPPPLYFNKMIKEWHNYLIEEL
jgi:hypothetical protein